MSRFYYPQARAILQVIFDGFGEESKDTEPLVVPVLPKEVRITRNSYRQADSWELVFDGNDLPIDPRLVRAGAVEIFLFETQDLTDPRLLSRAQQFEDTVLVQPLSAVDAAAKELALAAAVDRFTAGNRPQIAGLFDAHEIVLDESGKLVTISGQDYTDFLIKKQWPPLPNGRARRIPTGKRLDVLLREILRDADEEGRLELVVEGVEESAIPPVGRSEVRCHKRGIPIRQETSFWDVLYQLAVRHGFILFVRGLEVVLTRPQNLSEQAGARIKRLAWGHNLSSLTLARELGKEVAPTVVVKSYDPKTRRTIEVDHPPGTFQKVKRRSRKAKRTGKVTTSIKKSEEYTIVPMYGITDRKVLQKVAETRYNLLGRAERKVRFVTKDLRDFKGNPILDLASGDAVTVGFAEFNFELLANDEVGEEQKFNHLLARGFGEAVSRVIAQSYTKLRFLERPLRVREATIDYSVDDGITIEAELIDFIVLDGVRDSTARESRKDKQARQFSGKDGKPKGSAVLHTEDGDRDLTRKDST